MCTPAKVEDKMGGMIDPAGMSEEDSMEGKGGPGRMEGVRVATWKAIDAMGDSIPLKSAPVPSVRIIRRNTSAVPTLDADPPCWMRILMVSRGWPLTTPAMPPTPPARNSRKWAVSPMMGLSVIANS